MKKSFRLIIFITLVLTLVTIPIVKTNEVTAYAAVVKINKSKLTLEEGKTYTLKIIGTTKSVKWSSSNKKIATVTNDGKVKAVKAGTAVITAAADSKKYTCKVTVEQILTEKEATKNISFEEFETDGSIVLLLDNKNKINLCAELEVLYYNDEDVVYIAKDVINTFQSGKRAVRIFTTNPYIADNEIEYNHYKVSISALLNYEWTTKSYIDNITITSSKGNNDLIKMVTNNSKEDIGVIDMTALFYKDGLIVGASNNYVYDLLAGDAQTIEFSKPLDNNYNEISYDKIEIIINEAC